MSGDKFERACAAERPHQFPVSIVGGHPVSALELVHPNPPAVSVEPGLEDEDPPAATNRFARRSPLLIGLLASFEAQKVGYSCWKSSLRATRGMTGASDLDLLVARPDRQKATELLLAFGFKQWPDASGCDHPAIASFLGWDEITGLIHHVHIQFKIVFGHSLLKDFRLPVEDQFIARSVLHPTEPLRVLHPVDEALLLVVRTQIEFPLARPDRASASARTSSKGRQRFRGADIDRRTRCCSRAGGPAIFAGACGQDCRSVEFEQRRVLATANWRSNCARIVDLPHVWRRGGFPANARARCPLGGLCNQPKISSMAASQATPRAGKRRHHFHRRPRWERKEYIGARSAPLARRRDRYYAMLFWHRRRGAIAILSSLQGGVAVGCAGSPHKAEGLIARSGVGSTAGARLFYFVRRLGGRCGDGEAAKNTRHAAGGRPRTRCRDGPLSAKRDPGIQ